ncbi:GH25 family lysozyme [Pseudofulvibacter geojedonensis]|uniref:GH25 family lysozyme n=1 Tax=Pseudofulvibacter geojedonensis TaxID=1123758 RepID=A0ABW3HZY5_9FLAO
MKKYKNCFWMLFLGVILLSCQSKKVNPIDKESASKPKKILDTVDATKEKVKFVYGIDVSKYQGDEIGFLSKKSDSLSFVICKATEGITYIDPDFKHNWNMISEKKFIRGAYHFYRSNDDPKAQAKNFIQALASIEKTDLPPIIDFEEGGIDQTQSVEQVQSTLLVFINAVEKALNRKVIIYTDINTGNKYLNKSLFATYPLWIANYNNKSQPDLPIAWKKNNWILWQKTASYKIGTNLNDFDVFNGSLSDLKGFIEVN